jgi:D-arabinose 5-phosphate isomerase GutQ
MNKTNELLIITMEECSELIQACSKLMRLASEKDIDKKKLAEGLVRVRMEAADVQCMINLMTEREIIDRKEIGSMVVDKRKKLKKYSNLF